MKFDVLNCIETDRGLIVSLDVDEEGVSNEKDNKGYCQAPAI
jgi:hypothetical protein